MDRELTIQTDVLIVLCLIIFLAGLALIYHLKIIIMKNSEFVASIKELTAVVKAANANPLPDTDTAPVEAVEALTELKGEVTALISKVTATPTTPPDTGGTDVDVNENL